MIPIKNILKTDFGTIPVDPYWNTSSDKELKMHRIHAYPAKFPAFITTKALNYAEKHLQKINAIADIFCGCGTTAFEAKRNNIDFWGCDINPVATMIAKTKSKKYEDWRLKKYLTEILEKYESSTIRDSYDRANERLKYWYRKKEYNNLLCLKTIIEEVTPEGSDYRRFFLCAFSNILKAASVWLTKSIKPQVDPKKDPVDVIFAFKNQCKFMISANQQNNLLGKSSTRIVNGNFLDESLRKPMVDLIVTSPPYVTSYEYADLHQLSSLWLGFTADYRDLREGSIGSTQHNYNFNKEWKRLNITGSKIVSQLLVEQKPKAYSIAKYFLDIQTTTRNSYQMLNTNGMALFVIGNTKYKGVHIDNAKHLSEALENAGFAEILVTKRKISNKILTPFRDDRGKFTTLASGRKVYSEEFIIIGRK